MPSYPTIIMRLIAVITLIGASLPYGAHAKDLPYGPLRAFESDGCTMFPNGTGSQPNLWLDCCQKHDLRYWAGGTEDERLQADTELKVCVNAKGEFETANLMYEGVRLWGSPFLNTTWRWGFGWNISRGYAPLTPEEQEEVRRWQRQIQM